MGRAHRAAERPLASQHSRGRVWSTSDLMQAIVRTCCRRTEEIRPELPVKRVGTSSRRPADGRRGCPQGTARRSNDQNLWMVLGLVM